MHFLIQELNLFDIEIKKTNFVMYE